MARQFSTFSVVDILGHGVPNNGESAYPLQASSTQTGSHAAQHQDTTSTSTAVVSPFRRPGTVNQMLPPLPAVPTPPVTLHYDQQHLVSPQYDESENQSGPRAQTKKGRKGKRPPKRSRVSSDADDSLKSPAEEGEDEVFFNNQPTSNSTRRRASAARTQQLDALSVPPRDLNSAGELTPSPPAGAEDIPEGTSATSSKKRQEPLDDDNEEQPKKKRVRTAYSREQLHTLERHFRKSAYPDNHQLKTISRETTIDIPKVQVWFQNRRAKARKWGQMLPEPNSNSALYRGVLPNLETTRYLSPLHPSTQSTRNTTSTTPLTITTSPISHPPPSSSSSSTPLLQPYLSPSPYQSYYSPPPYPLHTSYPLLPPYPLPYSLYTTGVTAVNPPGTRSRAPITDDVEVQH